MPTSLAEDLAWSLVQLAADDGLTDQEVDQRVEGVTPLLTSAASRACHGDDHRFTVGAWLCLEGLRRELVRSASTLTADDALAAFQQVDPAARRGPVIYDE